MAYMHRLSQSPELSEGKTPAQNQRALALLEEWMSEPDDMSEEWWEEFEGELGEHRFSIHKAQAE